MNELQKGILYSQKSIQIYEETLRALGLIAPELVSISKITTEDEYFTPIEEWINLEV